MGSTQNDSACLPSSSLQISPGWGGGAGGARGVIHQIVKIFPSSRFFLLKK